jgi:hypothetical protein
VTLLFASLMAACGGGGGSPGTIVGPEALAVNAPAGLIQLVGTAQSFAITGGKAPFQALSNNELVAVAGVTGGTLTIGTVGVGTANITVRDAFGATVNVPLTSAVAQPLSTTAGTAITIEMGATQSFRIVGGAPGYTATSGNTNIAAASALGSTLTIIGIKPGATTVLVRDSVGSTVNIAVTVTTVGNLALFTTAPTALTVPIGATSVFSVGGGLGPFTAISSNPAVATVNLTDGTLTIQGIKTGSASISIRDSLGTTLPAISVTVPAPDALFTSASSAVTLGIGSHADFLVGGGLGTRLVSSSNAAVATGTFQDSATTDLRIDALTAGTANIQIRDSFGTAPVTIAVTVPSAATATTATFFTTAPANITLPNGGTASFTLGGGTAPYFATTDNTAVATVTQPTTTTILVTGAGSGDANITLTDSTGAVLSFGVHVNAGSGAVALFTTAPAAVTLAASTSQPFTIGGGIAPYTITNTNPFNVSAVITNTTTLTITGKLVGDSTLTIRDAAGSQVGITVHVIPPGSTLALLPTALSVDEANSNEIDLTIFGGVGPYRAFTSNAKLATVPTVTIAGPTLPVTSTSRCVTADTTVTLTVLDSLGASATSTLTVVNTSAAVCP